MLEPTYEGDFVLDEHLLLECGRTLANPTLHYAVYGRLNAARDNAVLVCHALSGSALVGSWWPEIFGRGAVLVAGARFCDLYQHAGLLLRLDGARLGEPGDRAGLTGRIFRWFRFATMYRAQAQLLDSLGIRRLRLVLGGSIGGMQALEWAIHDPGARGAGADDRRGAAVGHGAGAESSAAAGHPERSGLGGGRLPAAEAAAAGAGAGAADRDAELQIGAAV